MVWCVRKPSLSAEREGKLLTDVFREASRMIFSSSRLQARRPSIIERSVLFSERLASHTEACRGFGRTMGRCGRWDMTQY